MSLVYIDKVGKGSTKTMIVLGDNADSTDDFYKGYSMTVNSQSQMIEGYMGDTKTVILSNGLTSIPVINDLFIICNSKVKVILIGLVGKLSKNDNIVLNGGNNTDGNYNKNYLTVNAESMLIDSYVGLSTSATLSKPLTDVPMENDIYVISDINPRAIFLGISTSFIGGNLYFEILIVVCIIIVCISCIISLFFLIGGTGTTKSKDSSDMFQPQFQPQPMNFSISPVYYPPNYNIRN